MTVSLSITPPPEGTTLEVPLGQEQSFIFPGALRQEEALELSNLSVTLRGEGRTVNADVDAINSSYTCL